MGHMRHELDRIQRDNGDTKPDMKDPIIEEIHQVREAYARQFDYDIGAMFRDIQVKQAKRPNLVDLSKEAAAKHARIAEERASYGIGDVGVESE